MLSTLPFYQPVTEPFLYTFGSLVETLTDSYHYVVTTITEVGPNISALTRIYQVTDPYFITTVAGISLMVLCWLASIIADNYSIVNRLWSLLPPACAIYYLVQVMPPLSSAFESPTFLLTDIYNGLWINPRLALVVLLITIWGARLTFNCWRKGSYTWGEEDYRWRVVKAGMHPLTFQLLNLFFIVIYQLWLLTTLTAPAYLCWRMGFISWSWMDVIATSVFVTALIGETVADEQQWHFHQRKHSYETPGKRYRRRSNDPIVVVDADVRNGFLTSGLWRYSRHPNFFCEQAIWIAVYMFGTAVTGEWCRWDSAAVITLILLFQGSTNLIERITVEKYPTYATYQRTTSRLMPWWPQKMVTSKEHDQ